MATRRRRKRVAIVALILVPVALLISQSAVVLTFIGMRGGRG